MTELTNDSNILNQRKLKILLHIFEKSWLSVEELADHRSVAAGSRNLRKEEDSTVKFNMEEVLKQSFSMILGQSLGTEKWTVQIGQSYATKED